jgi:hypothetical protein
MDFYHLQGPCTMYFLEENVMELLYNLMGLDHSVSFRIFFAMGAHVAQMHIRSTLLVECLADSLRMYFQSLKNVNISEHVCEMKHEFMPVLWICHVYVRTEA